MLRGLTRIGDAGEGRERLVVEGWWARSAGRWVVTWDGTAGKPEIMEDVIRSDGPGRGTRFARLAGDARGGT